MSKKDNKETVLEYAKRNKYDGMSIVYLTEPGDFDIVETEKPKDIIKKYKPKKKRIKATNLYKTDLFINKLEK